MINSAYAVLLFIASGSVAAAELSFGELNGNQTYLNQNGVTCETFAVVSCMIERKSFAGIRIEKSMVLLNQENRITTVILNVFNFYFRDLIAALTERYGQPKSDERKTLVNKTGGPYQERVVIWPDFDNKGSLYAYQNSDSDSADVNIRFGKNIPPEPKRKIDF